MNSITSSTTNGGHRGSGGGYSHPPLEEEETESAEGTSSRRLNAFEIDGPSQPSSNGGANGSTRGTRGGLVKEGDVGLHMDGSSSSHAIIDPHAAELGGDIKSAILGIIKAMVGPAILYLPHGFVAAGYLVALPIMAISTVMYLHSSKCLLETWKFESEKQHEHQLIPQNEEGGGVDSAANGLVEEEEQLKLQEKEGQQETQRMSLSKLPSTQTTTTQSTTTTTSSLSYPELAYRAFGPKGETIVKVGIALMQSGVCLTYLIFVPHNLHSSLLFLIGWDIPTNFFLLLMLCVQIPLSWIQDIRKFTTTNALANACILYGLLVCLCFAFGQAITPYDPSLNKDYNPTNHNETTLTTTTINENNDESEIVLEDHGPIGNLWQHLDHLDPMGDHWILFIGTSVLLFEGSITLLIPLQEAVQPTTTGNCGQLNDRERFPTVYPQVILGIQMFYVIFAISCWMSFGDSVHTVLTTSLPPGIAATTVQLAYSIAVLFTFPLQNYPALEIACVSIAQKLADNHPGIPSILLQRNTIAAVIIGMLGIVAITTMESLDKVVSLTGALIGIPIAFIIPPLIHSQLMMKSSGNLHPWRLIQNYAVAALGTIAMVVASITTILQWND